MALGFFTGDNAPDSYDAIQRRRKLAEALISQSQDGAPIQSWTQGGAKLMQALSGTIQSNRLDAKEKESSKAFSQVLMSALGGGSPASMGAAPSPGMGAPAPMGGGAGRQASFSGGQEEFIKAMTPHAMKVAQETGLDPRLVIAKSALETGWGKSAPGNNFFGIKSHGRPGGNTMATNEVVGGQNVRVNDSFRAYGDMGQSAADYADFLKKNPRYGEVLKAKGLDAQVEALGRSGYATDPSYAQKIASIASGLQIPQQQPQPVQMASAGGMTPDGMPTSPVPSNAPPMSFAAGQQQPQGGPPMPPPSAQPMQSQQPPRQPPGAALTSALGGQQPQPQTSPPIPPPQPTGNVQAAMMAILADPRFSPQQKQQAMQMFQMQQAQGQVKPVDMGNQIALMDSRGNVVRVLPKQKDADFGVIGQDAFGTNQYGFIRKDNGTVTPVNPGAGPGAAQPSVTTLDGRRIDVPPGMDPKEFRKGITQEGAKVAHAAPDALRKAQEGIALIRATKNHPGLNSGTGYSSVLPDLPGTDRRAFAAYHDQLKGQAFLQAFEGLKGGGQITEVEGTKATQAIARLDRAQSPKDYRKALDDLEAILSGAVSRLQKLPGMQPPAGATAPANEGTAPARRRFNPATGRIE
jgi:flagellum-specific peptidoglycan hydrolase FlgJ